MDINKTSFLMEKQFPFLIDNYEVWIHVALHSVLEQERLLC